MSPVGSSNAPEARARVKIDAQLLEAGWVIQDRDGMNLTAGSGVAIREFKLESGHGFVDYLLFIDGTPVGVCEAKPAGHAPIGVEAQVSRYVGGLPKSLRTGRVHLPFAYIATSTETCFINHLDPHPRTRRVFSFHRPETLREWLREDTLHGWIQKNGGYFTAADDQRPSTLRGRLRAMPPVNLPGLWHNKIQAVINIEKSLFDDRPRSLVQMATGSGKTLLAVTTLYRLIKFGGARRVLFLVDRGNLGKQAFTEFDTFRTPDDNRLLRELYGIQRLTSNTIGASSKIVICTIQRLYSILKGEPDLDPALEDGDNLDAVPFRKEPLPVVYNRAVPPEFFDVIFVDECHRSIYTLWLQVLEYFDAHLIGLTATPAGHTYGFFNQNVVMEYPHEQAVVDGVNCDYEVYKIRTKITEQGATVQASSNTMLTYRDRLTRALRWQAPDEDVTYGANELDESVVALDQIRLIVRTFRDKVLGEAFPDRKEVPKTLVFAKDDSHAEDIVAIFREEFGRGNEFAQKITYKVTGESTDDLIQKFRISYDIRVAVTVDLIATGTDIKPVEILIFMRSVKSRVLFEQMKGRGVRVIHPDALRAVTPDAKAKTHFLIVDCVGVCDRALTYSKPLDKKPSASLKELLDHVAANGVDEAILSSLASRLARIDKQCGPDDRKTVIAVSGGLSLADLARRLLDSLDPDQQDQAARTRFGLAADAQPTEEQVEEVALAMKREAILPLMSRPELRKTVLELRHRFEQVIDGVTIDTLIDEKTGISQEAKDKARALVMSFAEYLEGHKDELDALQFFYSVPHQRRLRRDDIKALAAAISAPPRSWTPERLWHAYQTLEGSKVRGASAGRLLTDVVSLVRYTLDQDPVLIPHADRVHERFQNWLAQQGNRGRAFTPEQVTWLAMMKDHIATSLEIDTDDFDFTPFAAEGGLAMAAKLFGKELPAIVVELNEVLAA